MIPTFKRVIKRSHHIYSHDEVDEVLDYLSAPSLKRGAIAKIARDTGIPEPTLRDWHRQRVADATWFPLANGHPRARALDPHSEAAIGDLIRENYIQPGIGATRADLKGLCLDAYAEQADYGHHRERFCASTTFLRDMEHRQGLSLRTPHHERRTTLDEDYTTYFLERLGTLPDTYPPECVFNLDETSWRLFEGPRKVLAEKGSETVKLRSKTSEKTSFTAIGAISAAGEKLPLWVLAKGKSPRCEHKFGTHPDIVVQHTPSGWATDTIIARYIEWLSREITRGLPSILVLDVYPSHRTDLVIETAAANDVELLFVPAGATGRFQPLDRRVFGELKARARAEFGRRMWRAHGADIDHNEGLEILRRCWNAIPPENVRKAWDVV
jgi:hypothetical protein